MTVRRVRLWLFDTSFIIVWSVILPFPFHTSSIIRAPPRLSLEARTTYDASTVYLDLLARSLVRILGGRNDKLSTVALSLVRCHMVLLEVEVEICNGNLIVGKHHVSHLLVEWPCNCRVKLVSADAPPHM
jgi:hypothetical protein